MENREQQILSEIKAMMASIRIQLEQLDQKMAELQQTIDPEEVEPMSIDISLDDAPVAEAYPEAHSEVDSGHLPVELPEPEIREEPVILMPVAEDEDDDLPFGDMPAEVPVIDAMAARQAWRTDMPGTPVKDIRSAISLNDRIIFINYLFDEDPMVFQESLTRINTMESLDQVVDYLSEARPTWDMDSDVVYRFMMAVRRRVK